MHQMPLDQKTELNGAVLQALVARGRRLRAEAFRAALGKAARPILRPILRLARAGWSAARAAARRYRDRRKRRLAIAELQDLDDRTLKDIGLSRGDIARLVRQLHQRLPVEEATPGAEVVPLPLPRARSSAHSGKLAA